MISTELYQQWADLSNSERVSLFRELPHDRADQFFLGLSSREQVSLLLALPDSEQRSCLRLLPPDDAADLIQLAPEEDSASLAGQLDDVTRREVNALLAYKEDAAGGLMNPRFARVRPDMTIDEAISYLRRQADHLGDTALHLRSGWIATVARGPGLPRLILGRPLQFGARRDANRNRLRRRQIDQEL